MKPYNDPREDLVESLIRNGCLIVIISIVLVAAAIVIVFIRLKFFP